MANIRFTVDFFNDGEKEKHFMRSGVALKGVPYPEKIADLTPEEARMFIMQYDTALLALARHAKDKIVSAGILTREEAYNITPQEPLTFSNELPETD